MKLFWETFVDYWRLWYEGLLVLGAYCILRTISRILDPT